MNKPIIITAISLLALLLAGCQSAVAPATPEQQSAAPAQSAPAGEVAPAPEQTAKTPADKAQTGQETLKIQTNKEIKTTVSPAQQTTTQKITQDSAAQKNTVTAPATQESLKGITIKADGFAPSNMTIKPGTTVIFINMDDNLHWPASAIHPTHEVCSGFDALKGLAKNETYTFTFTQAKTCPFHDHLNPALKGKIVVQ